MALSSKMGKLFLNKEVSIQDLSKGVEFEVDCDEHYTDSEDETYFDDEAFQTFKEDIVDFNNDKRLKMLGGASVPFSELKERMQPITEDKKIFKEIIKQGVGIQIPDKSVVMMHYDAYVENEMEPFDSTRLRKRPYKFLIGDWNVLPGLEIGIKTMKKEETSRFLVSPDYAYGEMGCAPRIPPSAEILYEVEILNFYKSKDAIEFEDMTPEDQKKAPFEKVVSVYHCEHEMANDLFHRKLYSAAIARYRKAVKILESVSVADEEEDEKRNGYLLKLYLNLAQCYLNIFNPSKAIIYSGLALRIDGNNPKALYRMGYAHHLNDDFEKAEHYLTRAKKFKPYEKMINVAIARLESKRKKHLEWEKMFWKKALFKESDSCEEKADLRETAEFISVIEEQIREFVNSDERELAFSSGYTEEQVEVVKEVAKKYNLAFVTKIICDLKINKVVKRNI